MSKTVRQPHIENRENLNARPGKEFQTKQPAVKPKRPALGEVGNKLHGLQAQQNVCMKKEPVYQSCLTKKLQSTTTTVTVQRKESLVKKTTCVKTIAVKTDKSTVVTKTSVTPVKKTTVLDKEEIITKVAAYSTVRLDGVVDVDAGDRGDPLLVADYIRDIYNYLRDVEIKFPIQPNFLNCHGCTPRMRHVLINWMVEVHTNFSFLPETLHLSVGILDRYLQNDRTVGRSNLQLVGTTALFIASKYEELYIPDLSDFVYIVDDSFKKRELLQMEMKILCGLDWGLGRPLSLHFLRRYSKLAKVQPEQHVLAKYLLEIALFEYELCHVHPSLQAAAAICFSIAILTGLSNPSEAWTNTLVRETSYGYLDFRPVIIGLAQALMKMETSKYQAIRKKYATSSNWKISMNPKLKGTLVKCLALKTVREPSKPAV